MTTLTEQTAVFTRHAEERRAAELVERQRVIVLDITGRLPHCARSGWVPETPMPWLEQLRGLHETAVGKIEAALLEVPAVVQALEVERSVSERQAGEHYRARMAAALSGGMVPSRPSRFSAEVARGRYDEAWVGVERAFAGVRSGVEAVAVALTAHDDDLYRCYVGRAEALAMTGQDPGVGVMASWIEATADQVQRTVALSHLDELLRRARGEYAPRWLPASLAGAVYG